VPRHDYFCRPCNEVEERYTPVNELHMTQRCHCGSVMERVFLRAPMGLVQPDVCYASPVDGRPITNKHEHLEELARTDTVVYEPGIKQDQDRNERRRSMALERSIDETVEREVALMPAAKREKLAAELQGGLTAVPERVTPAQISYKEAQ
jgi:hypothetical protein